MPEYELIQQRNISGKGILRVPTDARKNRAYILYASVFRRPLNEYENRSYNPHRSRYGTLVFLREDYVIGSCPIEYRKQAFDGVNDISGQTLLAVKCAYEGVLESIFRLSVNLAGTPGSVGLTPVNYTNGIADYLNLRLAWDECRLVCYADTAIQLSLYRLVYDVCDEVEDEDIPPPVPDPIPEVPQGTPIEGIDPPYDDEDDDGNSVPFPADVPPLPTPCVTIIRGAGLNTADCTPLDNQGDYPYNGYAELIPITYLGCPGLQVYLDGVDLGPQQIFHSSAIILSREGDCVPPPE